MQDIFGSSKANIKPTIKVEVELGLSDGTTLTGHLFISPTERILETLNDPRAFLPFEGSDVRVRVLSKSIITSIKMIETSITLIEPELEKAQPKLKAVETPRARPVHHDRAEPRSPHRLQCPTSWRSDPPRP